MNEKLVTEKFHFIAKELMRKIRWTWNDTIGTIKIVRRIQNHHSVQVPALNTPDYFAMYFDDSSMVNYGSKIAQEGRELRCYVLRSSKPTVEKSRVRPTRFEQRWNKGQTFQHASGNRCLHKAGKSRPPRKQQLRERLQQQQSFINASENEVHWYKERHPSIGRNLGVHTISGWQTYTHSKIWRRVHILCCRMWNQAQDQHFIAKAGLVTEGTERNEENHMIFFINHDADEAEEFTDLKKPRKVNSKIHWRSEQHAKHWILLSATQKTILADSVYAIITYLSMLKECVVKVVNQSGDENYSQDNLCLERTRSNAPKYLGSWRLRRLVQFFGSRDQNCRCGIRESQLVERGITSTRSTCKSVTQGQQSEWEGREEDSWSRQPRVA